jgi:hypothetical protein
MMDHREEDARDRNALITVIVPSQIVRRDVTIATGKSIVPGISIRNVRNEKRKRGLQSR